MFAFCCSPAFRLNNAMAYVLVFLLNVVGLAFGLECAFNSSSELRACSLNRGAIKCNLPTNGRKRESYVIFKHGNETFSATPSTYTFCASIDYFWRKGNGYTENVYFYPDTPTGRLTVDRQCWDASRRPDCFLSFKVPPEIAALSIFKYRSSDERFWDFQNVVYQKPENFLQGIELKVNYEMNFRWIASLNNTSIETLLVNNNTGSVVEFGSMRNLRNLFVYFGHLTTLPADSPMILRNVTNLGLTYNCLNGIPEFVADLEDLEELTVSHNTECRGDLAPPFVVSADIFRRLLRLSYLDLSVNGIMTLSLPPMPALKDLVIESSNLSDVLHIRNVVAGTNLTRLMLSGNRLCDDDIDILSALLPADSSLHILDVSDNDALTRCPRVLVNSLVISGNNITDLEACVVAFRSADFLDISHNSVRGWNNDHLFTGNVQTIDLANNAIRVITEPMSLSLESVRSYSLDGNPFDCGDCAIVNLQNLIRELSTDLECAAPLEFRGVNVLNVAANVQLCFPPKSAIVLDMAVALGVVGACIVAFGIVAIRFRYHLRYMVHLHKVKRKIKLQRGLGQTALFDAFVCYSGNDRTWVMDSLKPLMEGEPYRYSLCLHERDFTLGSRIVDNILQAIEESNKVIIILSSSFIQSKWCQWELEMVNHRMFDSSKSGYIILVQLEPIDENLLPSFLKVVMNTHTCLQWPRDSKLEVKHEILARLALALGSSIHRTNSENAPLIVNVHS